MLSTAIQLDWLILVQDSWPWPKGSNEWGLSVLLFRRFLEIGSLVFSATLHGVRSPGNVVYDSQIFWKSCFLPQKWGKYAKPSVLWKSSAFFFQFFFLSIWSILKVYVALILLCLNKFHIWENFGFWDMTQNPLGHSDCGIFRSIARL